MGLNKELSSPQFIAQSKCRRVQGGGAEWACPFKELKHIRYVRTLRAAHHGFCLSVGLMSLKEEDQDQLELVLILITAASEKDTF